MGHSEECPREDRNFKERGEDFFFISCTIIIPKNF